MKKLILLFLINILINFYCIGKSPVENKPIKIYEMTVVEVIYYDLYCYNDIKYDWQIIINKKLKTNIGKATGNIQVFEKFFGFGGSYFYPENYPLLADSKAISGIDSLNDKVEITNDKIIVKIYENFKNLSEFVKENSKGKTYFRIAYIKKIHICGILIN